MQSCLGTRNKAAMSISAILHLMSVFPPHPPTLQQYVHQTLLTHTERPQHTFPHSVQPTILYPDKPTHAHSTKINTKSLPLTNQSGGNKRSTVSLIAH
jgi:hypothetical protein